MPEFERDNEVVALKERIDHLLRGELGKAAEQSKEDGFVRRLDIKNIKKTQDLVDEEAEYVRENQERVDILLKQQFILDYQNAEIYLRGLLDDETIGVRYREIIKRQFEAEYYSNSK